METKLVKKYRKLQKRQLELKYQEDPAEEARVIDVMQEVWSLLSEEERDFIENNQEPGFTEDPDYIVGFGSRLYTFGGDNGIPYSEWDVSDSPEVVAKMEQLADFVREHGVSPGPSVMDGGSYFTFTFRGETLRFENCDPMNIPPVFGELVKIFTGWQEDEWAKPCQGEENGT